MSQWDELKGQGSQHYKTGGVEPIDLYVAGNMFDEFAICSIIKYAFRSRPSRQLDDATFAANMDKIIDYAQKLKARWNIESVGPFPAPPTRSNDPDMYGG